jgi:hypothetical protein
VPAGSTCAATPITKGDSSTYNGGPVGLLYEDWIGSSTAPTIFGGCLDPRIQSSATQAFVSADNVTSDTLQLTYAWDGGAVPIYDLQWFNPGTYTIGGSAHFNVTLTAGEQAMWLWHHTGLGIAALTRCDLGTLAPGASSTCTN